MSAQPHGASLRLLGDPAIQLPDGSVRALERRAAGLLALVALEPGVTRARAAALLWPQSDDSRKALRQQLLRFRKLFGVMLVSGDEALRLADGVATDLDSGSEPLLGALGFEDCEEFADWLARQRDARRARQSAPLQEQLAAAEAQHDYDRALALAEQLAALEPESEMHARVQIRLHYLRGDLARAQAVYEQLKRMLLRRFGAAPSAQTEEVARAVAAARDGPSGRAKRTEKRASNAARALALPPTTQVATRTSPPVTVLRPPYLVGRSAELAALHAAWQDGRVVLVLGEAGMGKTRLGTEFASGQAVISAQGRPGDAGVPYALLARLLREVLQRCTTSVPTEQRNELARLLPELAPGVALSSDGQRLRLQQAIEALLADAQIDRAPLRGLLVDDLHFADSASVEMLQSLLASPALSSVRWLLLQRPGEGEPAATRLRDALTEAGLLATVVLTPLAAAELAELADSLQITGLDSPALATALARHTGGNPLFALETLKLAITSGSLSQGRLPQPATVGALIERRLAQVSELALGVARVAAIAGIDFDILLAEAVMKRSAVELASAWRELEDAQVLRGDAFAHDLVWDAVLRTIPAAIARRLHAQCAEFLEARGGEPARVAEHWLAGGEMARAGAAFVAAARRAERAARQEEEATLLLRAARAYEAAGLPDERFTALRNRAIGLVAIDISVRGIDAARELVDLASDDRQRLQAHVHYVGTLAEVGRSEQTIEVGRPALALALRSGDNDSAVRLACHVASALARLGRVEEALAVLLPLGAWVKSQPDPLLIMIWHGDLALLLGASGRFDEAVATYDAAIAAARVAGSPDGEARLMMNCAVTLRESGQFDRALALAQQSRARYPSDDSDDAGHVLIGRLVIARDQAESGCFEPALATLTDILPCFESSGATFWAQAVRMVLVRLWLDLGQFARAVPLLTDEPVDIPPWLRADRHFLHRELMAATRGGPAIASLETTLALVHADERRGLSMRVRALRHLAADEVLARADTLEPALYASGRKGVLLSLHTQVARAASEAGLPARAAQAARAIVDLTEAGYAPDSMYRAEAWLIAHRALAAAGEADAAAQALEQGCRWVRQHALPHVPAPFIDSFLRRNRVNAALLADTPR